MATADPAAHAAAMPETNAIDLICEYVPDDPTLSRQDHGFFVVGITTAWILHPSCEGLYIRQHASTRKAPFVLNRSDRSHSMAGEAELKYLDGDFRIVRAGAFVRCAVTGVPIPLDELKYWSVELQEPYASPEAVLQRHSSRQAKG